MGTAKGALGTLATIAASSSLVGAAGADGGFVPNKAMLQRLFTLTDVRKAVATVPEDATRELSKVQQQEGGADAVNTLCRGAIAGANLCMERRDAEAHTQRIGREHARRRRPKRGIQGRQRGRTPEP